ncbi:sigma-70 family RNA polymerase sigma factor [Spirillospora sp. NPDC047279]|uniref:sigma-70 family RNA polymerase sigma factor n=1 Tax=Spirillospora sp. NPDC047279 TaxID=3155478 RepID=UPI0033D60172
MDDLDRLVGAARAGDEAARERLVHEHLPLVYNVVGRALDGHADVDDVVQDTMVRALRGLGGLRDPARFRSWLVAIAMNQVRRRWRSQRDRPVVGLDDETAAQVADPAADFAEVTIARLGLTGQRREVAAATRWLDEADRELLALWWLEAAGALTRAELAAAAGLSTRHAAVRVKRMKEQLDTGRSVVRALAAEPLCGELAELTAGWDGRPSPLWRKRVARHVRGCRACKNRREALVPAEMLLAGLALVPVAPALLESAPGELVAAASSLPAAPVNVALGPSGGHGLSLPGGGWTAATAGAAAAAAVVVIAVLPDDPPRSEGPVAVSPVPDAGRRTVPPPSPSPAAEADRLAPRKTARPVAASGPEAQVVALVNAQRSRQGCGPLRADPRLTTAARRHSADMAARGYFDHTSPDGKGPGDRIDATGFRWSSWAENIAKGQGTASSVMTSWMNSPGHRSNIVNCRFSLIGVGLVTGSGGPYWTQVFATPR